jgi:hypothetical protein
MGTLASSMRNTYVRKFGKRQWVKHVKVIDEMWSGIAERIKQINLPFPQVRPNFPRRELKEVPAAPREIGRSR